ncbi:MAG: AIR synthase family protein [Candidatus Lokiarchaeota archaeon]|nr:AIR synthase family protein [Candidatus Lokiarchaeota archaeon]
MTPPKKTPKEEKVLPIGKLSMELLSEIFKAYNSPKILKTLEQSNYKEIYNESQKRVILGFGIGEDAAIISMENSSKYLVTKTDPITFATEDIGYYVVNINANDIAAMGATPKWFQATILLPAGIATEQTAKKICLDIQTACLRLGILLIGGHTEVTYDLNRPIVIGSMFGEVLRDNYVQSGGGKSGDAIILTKGIPLEGTSIIAREKEKQLLDMGITEEVIRRSKDLLFHPGISIMKEALLAVKHFNIHSMHDPTEGGLAMGLVELSKASNCGFQIEYEKIPIIPEGKKLCEIFKLNPLQTLSSGSLLIVLEDKDSDSLLQLMRNNGIIASKIGNLTATNEYLIITQGKTSEIRYDERDEITKIFNS